jgi:hypothetical protein
MINDSSFDTRFCVEPSARKVFLGEWVRMKFTTQDLKDIINCADKLEIPEYCTRPTVDVLYDIAVKLTLFEAEVVHPTMIMDRIREYIRAN